jgi:hypothetical protein
MYIIEYDFHNDDGTIKIFCDQGFANNVFKQKNVAEFRCNALNKIHTTEYRTNNYRVKEITENDIENMNYEIYEEKDIRYLLTNNRMFIMHIPEVKDRKFCRRSGWKIHYNDGSIWTIDGESIHPDFKNRDISIGSIKNDIIKRIVWTGWGFIDYIA